MSINPVTQYPGKVAPATPDNPFGTARNITIPGDGTGTPWESALLKDEWGFQHAMLINAGMEPNGTPDSAENSQLFKAAKASIGNGANLLSNHNFIIQSPDDTLDRPGATPRTYPAGYQIFSGVFASEVSGITNLTYVDGRVSFSGGDFYMAAPKTGAIARLTADQLTASVADFNGKPRTRGVSFALVGDEYRVTVGIDALEDAGAALTPLGSVKLEQGSVATSHDVQTLKGQAFTFNTVAEMISSKPTVGSKVRWLGYYEASDGGSNWGTVKSGSHTEDGGSIFSISPTTYIEANLKGGRVSIKKFGSKDSLSHDSTVSTQNSLDYVATNKRATWHIPEGDFLITEPLDARSTGSGFGGKFSGEGYASALYYRPANVKANPVVPSGSDGEGIFAAGCINFGNDNTRGSIWKDFRIVMDGDKFDACGLSFYKWYQGHVKNVVVEGAECGIYASFAWSGSIKKCNTLSCTNGIIVNNTTIFDISTNNVGAGSTGITFGWNLYGDNISQPNEFTQGVALNGNTIQSCSEYAIYGKNTANTSIGTGSPNYTEGNCAGPYPNLEALVGDARFNGCEVVIDHDDSNPYGNSDLVINNNWWLSNQAVTKRLLGLKNVLGFDFKNNNSYTTTKFFSGNIPVDIEVSGTLGMIKTDASLVIHGGGTTQTPRDFAGVRSGAFASSMPQYTVAQLVDTGSISIPAGESRTVLMPYNLASVADYSRISWTCNDLTGLDLTFKIGSYADNRGGSLLRQLTQDATVSIYDPGRTRVTFSGVETVVLPEGIQYVFIEITNTAGVARTVTYPTLTTNTSRGEFAALLVGGAAPNLLLESAVSPVDPIQMTLLNY